MREIRDSQNNVVCRMSSYSRISLVTCTIWCIISIA